MENEPDLSPLAPGTQLHAFVLRDTIGCGGTGIVYAADHQILRETFAIKEFLPRQLAHRIGDRQVAARPGKTAIFDKLRQKFLEEGQTLIQLARPYPHPNLVQVTDAFRANETVYLCMRFESGKSLERLLEEQGPIAEEQLQTWLLALMDGLEHAHGRRVWHRDIKPSNILIRDDGTPVIIDFGAARQERPDSAESLISLYTPGFAAPEQLFQGHQGPWTDIYALAATCFFAMTGHHPEPRMAPDWHDSEDRYSRRFLEALSLALRFDPERRPSSIAAWRALLVDHEPEGTTIPLNKETDIMDEATRVYERPPSHGDDPTWILDAPPREIPAEPPREGNATGPTRPTPTQETQREIATDGPAAEQEPRRRRMPFILGIAALLLSAATLTYLAPQWRQPFQESETRALFPDPEPPTEPEPLQQPSPDISSAIRTQLTGLECGHLDVSRTGDTWIRLSGYLRDRKQQDTLLERLDAIAPGIRVVTRDIAFAAPFCRLLAALNPGLQHEPYPGIPEILFDRPNRIYREGQYLVLRAANSSASGGYLYLDFVDGDGSVVHLFPTAARRNNYLGPDRQVRIGANGTQECERRPDDCYVVSHPHGNNLILAVWSEQPIFEDARRPQSEPAQAYLPLLTEALEQSARNRDRFSLDYHFFTTVP